MSDIYNSFNNSSSSESSSTLSQCSFSNYSSETSSSRRNTFVCDLCERVFEYCDCDFSNKILFIGNEKKFKEISEFLNDFLQNSNIHFSYKDINIVGIKGSLEEIIKSKALLAYMKININCYLRPVIVESISLSLNALNGLPGPYIEDFLKLKPKGIIKLLSGYKNKTATIKCIYAYCNGEDKDDISIFTGEINGKIVNKPRGVEEGLDSIFQPDGEDWTLSEMSHTNKNRISHHTIALDKLKKFLYEKEIHKNYPENIIAYCGKIGSGKSTACERIKKTCEKDLNVKFKRISIADGCRDTLALVLDIKSKDMRKRKVKSTIVPEFNLTIGQLLQRLGPKMREFVHTDYWVYLMDKKLRQAKKDGYKVVCIDDVRYPNEIDAIKNKWNGKIYKIIREHYQVQNDGRDMNDSSETILDNISQSEYIKIHNNCSNVDEWIKMNRNSLVID